MPGRARLLVRNVLVAAAYIVTGQLGLLVPFTHSSASPLWPPSGLSLAAVLSWGPAVLPGVFLGSIVTTMSTGAGLLPSLGVGVGNVLEPFLATVLLRRVGFRKSFERVQDVVAFFVLGTMLCTAISATFGVGSLHLAGIIREHVAGSWVSWWTGNGMGVLLIAPLLFVWTTPRLLPPMPRWRTILLLAGTVGALCMVFGPFSPLPLPLREEALLFPFLIWAALDHGPRGGLLASLGVTAFALWRSAAGEGPFGSQRLWEQVWLVQVFSGVSTLTSLVLGAAIVERRRAVDLRDEFISVASHELKTPITTLNLEIDALRAETAGQPQLAPLRDVMQRQLDRLGRLVDAMLDIARLTGGPLPLDREEVDLGALARGAAERSQELFAEAGSTLDIRGSDVRCVCDRLRIDQALSNLLSNAAKYGAGKPVVLEVAEEGDEVVIRVKDHGIGIAPVDQQRIFQRFERAAPDRAIGGLGLGLYIVAQIAEAHAGEVSVESARGEGATFTLRLPKS